MTLRRPHSLFAIAAFAVVVLVYAAVQFAAWQSLRGAAEPRVPAAVPDPTDGRPASTPAPSRSDSVRVVVRVSARAPGVEHAVWQVSASRSPLADVDLVHGRAAEIPNEHVLELPPGGEWTVRAEGVVGDLRLRLARTVKATNGTIDLAWTVTDGAVRGRLKPDFAPDARVKLAGRLADGTAVGATIGIAADGSFEFPFAIAGRYGLAIDGRGDRRTIVTAVVGQTVDAGEF